MKESGYVLLGMRGYTNRSVFAIARGNIIPDTPNKGCKEIQLDDPSSQADKKMKQLQGKSDTKVVIARYICTV